MKKSSKIILSIVGLVVVAVVAVAALGSHKSDTSMQMTMATSSTNRVTIHNYMFEPTSVKIAAGTTVTWTNQDSVGHTITADTVSKDAPSSMTIATGKSYSFTFKKAGKYTYHCFPHPYMHGTVEVTK